MEATFAAAINYVEKHGFSVIPLTDGGRSKKPAVSWEPYQTRRPIVQQLEEWFAETDYGIGIVCGAISGIVVADDDLYYATGAEPDLSGIRTPTVRTGNLQASYHRYYLYGERGFGRQDFSQALKLRGDRHYVVAPPSIHVSGNPYYWVTTFEDCPPAPIPAVLFNGASGFDFSQYQATKAAALPVTIPAGGRYEALLSLAGTLRNRGLDAGEIAGCLDIVNQTRCDPPVEDERIVALALDVVKRYEPKSSLMPAHLRPEPELSPLKLARLRDEEEAKQRMAEAILHGD